jgi:hypothetical protein
MSRTTKTREYFLDPQNMLAIIRRNAIASSAFEGASARALKVVADRHQDNKASSKKRASGS